MTKNPYIEPHNYFSGYEASAEKLKDNPEIFEFTKMCYELLEHNPQGKKFMEYIEKRFLLPSLCQLNSANYQIDVIHKEGFKEAFRMLKNTVEAHKLYIKAETNKA